MTTQENNVKEYNKNIKNAKSIKRLLEKSWLRPSLLENITFFVDNYKLENEINEGVYDFCNKNHIHLTTLSWISRPFKITSFSKNYLEMIKKDFENWKNDTYYNYGRNYDFSISINPQEKKAWYSREYKGCANWYYYIMLNNDTAYLYDID